MSGDVFGNGMLLSDRIRLVGAYDHRHIFLDPDPDPDASFAERKRLFDLAGSSWNDYDRAKISEGGGVWPRAAKRIPLSEATQSALGIEDESLAPNDLIRAILRAPVDLLWNGGIGTDREGLRRDRRGRPGPLQRRDPRRRVRAARRAVGEGGNLGLTRRARVEFARKGGRINADFIDNSAGVDCSDHEVNLKILLGLAERRGELTRPDRDVLLSDMTEDVVDHVLYDSFLQAQIIAQEAERSAGRLDAYEDLMAALEEDGLLDRASEALPVGRGAGRPAPRRPRHGAPGAREPADLRQAAGQALAARLAAARRPLARGRPARLLPARGGRALRAAAGRAPAAARADRDRQRQPRRQRARARSSSPSSSPSAARRPPRSSAPTGSPAR